MVLSFALKFLLLCVDGCCCREDGEMGAEVTQVTMQLGREQLEGYPFCNKGQRRQLGGLSHLETLEGVRLRVTLPLYGLARVPVLVTCHGRPRAFTCRCEDTSW